MKLLHKAGLTAGAVAGALALAMVVLAARTEADIRRHHLAVAQAGRASPSAAMPTAMPTAMPAVMPAVMPSASGDPSDASAVASAWASLPAPVQRYFAYTFRGQAPRLAFVELQMEGEFRRPKTQVFTPTTAEQTVATGVPAMMFSATTEMLPGIWARAYDAYVDGRMEMKAKVLSAVTVVDEKSSPELDRISLRRWLLESALYPMALLPGGPVRWEAIDTHRARAVATYQGVTASMVASFDSLGRLQSMHAEADGDLQTPYHGSGEHVTRSDYQPVDGVMLPMSFVIARAAGGKIYPFWRGHITHIRFAEPAAMVAHAAE